MLNQNGRISGTRSAFGFATVIAASFLNLGSAFGTPILAAVLPGPEVTWAAPQVGLAGASAAAGWSIGLFTRGVEVSAFSKADSREVSDPNPRFDSDGDPQRLGGWFTLSETAVAHAVGNRGSELKTTSTATAVADGRGKIVFDPSKLGPQDESVIQGEGFSFAGLHQRMKFLSQSNTLNRSDLSTPNPIIRPEITIEQMVVSLDNETTVRVTMDICATESFSPAAGEALLPDPDQCFFSARKGIAAVLTRELLGQWAVGLTANLPLDDLTFTRLHDTDGRDDLLISGPVDVQPFLSPFETDGIEIPLPSGITEFDLVSRFNTELTISGAGADDEDEDEERRRRKLKFRSVPEPASFFTVLPGLGVIFLLGRRRRRMRNGLNSQH